MKICITLIIVTTIASLQAVPITYDLYYNAHKDHFVHAIGDAHVDTPSNFQSPKYQADSINYTKSLPSPTNVLTEDALSIHYEQEYLTLLSNLNHNEELPMYSYPGVSSYSPLHYSKYACQAADIDATNIESRHYWDHTQRVFREIKSYQDGPQLQQYYRQSIEYGPVLKKIEQLAKAFVKYGEEQQRLNKSKKPQIDVESFNKNLDKLKAYFKRHKFLEPQIIHTIHNNAIYKNTVVIAGALHTERIRKPLTQIMGYKHIARRSNLGLLEKFGGIWVLIAYLTMLNTDSPHYWIKRALDLTKIKDEVRELMSQQQQQRKELILNRSLPRRSRL